MVHASLFLSVKLIGTHAVLDLFASRGKGLIAAYGSMHPLLPILMHILLADDSTIKCLYRMQELNSWYTANSKKVVLRKSKIQITKYKIQEKVCLITHISGLLTTSP